MKNKFKEKFGLHPIMTYIILIAVVIFMSFVLSIMHTQSTHKIFSLISRDYKITTEAVTSLLNLSGIKYIFTNTVSNFANFTILPNLIIMLIGIGIMEASGFVKTFTYVVTKNTSKFKVTFFLVLFSLIASLFSDLMFLAIIPITALIFYHAKRNPVIGIVAVYAALTIGNGISVLLTSVDSSLIETTILNARILDPKYSIGIYSFVLISAVLIIASAFLITSITERQISEKLPKYEFEEDNFEIKNNHLRGLIFAAVMGVIYLIIIIYNIIPGLPFSGNLLDYSQNLYIDKLFSYNSFFSQGYVFILSILFIILGLFYGKGAKTINNNKDVAESLSSSLDGIGKPLLLIFLASTLISIFKQTNIGVTVVTVLSNLLTSFDFTGFPLIILLFIVSATSTILVPQSLIKWPVIAATSVPLFMKTGLSPEFAQIIFRLGESITLGVTPLFAYFVLYLAYIEKYNQKNSSINLFTTIKYQFYYVIPMLVLYIVTIILWYIAALPLGIKSWVFL